MNPVYTLLWLLDYIDLSITLHFEAFITASLTFRYFVRTVVSVLIRMTTIVPGLLGGTVHEGICVKHTTIMALDFSFFSISLCTVGMY